MTSASRFKLIFGGLLVAAIAACGGGGGGGGGSADNGTLRLALTDAPACGYDAVNVTVEKIRVHKSDSAGTGDGGWSEIVLNPAKRVDLLNLTNGVLSELGQTALPAGKYTQLRLVLAKNTGANPLLNSIIPTGGAEVALTTPSAQQSGFKVKINIDIEANKTADFVLDFDACKSIVLAGGSGQYILKPVVNAIGRYTSGVSGSVESALMNTNTSLSLQKDGVIVKATAPTSGGTFLLQPVAPGNYTLVLTAPGRATAVITNVVVSPDTVTSVNASGSPLNPPSSTTGIVNGVTTVDAFLKVQQQITGGPKIVVASGQGDDAGAYSFTLPIAAPVVAPYVAAPASLVFTADNTAAAKYSITASLSGFADKTTALATLNSVTPITTNFTFP